jgi:ketosteroid isomerase-like protein
MELRWGAVTCGQARPVDIVARPLRDSGRWWKAGLVMSDSLSPANAALIQEYLRIATETDDLDRFGQLLAEDCVWVLMPTSHAFRGVEQVAALATTAGGTRTHDEAHRVTILNWFAAGDNFCVEYQHGAVIKRLGITGVINICLVCHMREGKFDRIDEYIHAHGTLFKLVMSIGLRILPLMVRARTPAKPPAPPQG